MYKLFVFFLTLATVSTAQVRYPESKKIEHFDTYFGHQVEDPYRWLEDDKSKETEDWVTRQNKVTFEYLDKIPYRKLLKEKLTTLWNYEKYSIPVHEGYYYYFFKNDGLQKHSVMYRKNVKSGDEEVFFDPNTYSPDGTVPLMEHYFSKDGSMVALAFSDGGSDWRKVMIMDCSYKTFVDSIFNVKFSEIAWKGNEGFYYSTYERDSIKSELSSKTQYHKLMYHKLGANQSADKFIFGGRQDAYRYIRAEMMDNQDFIVISAANNTKKNDLYFQNTLIDDQPIYHLTPGIETRSDVITSRDGAFYIFTDYKAPNGRLVKVDITTPRLDKWEDVIREQPFPISVNTGGGYFWVTSTEDVKNKVYQFSPYGNFMGEVKMPSEGTVGGFGCKDSDSLIFFTFTNSINPSTIYRFDISSRDMEIYKSSKIDFNTADFETKQVFYTSKDGTKIPMTLTYKKGINLNGKNPTILYGYGGFNISLMPSFNTTVAFWIKLGGVYAVANLRGGGEYGNKWHEQGIKRKKQNVFDDFLAAGEYLKSAGYTSSDYLAILGRSNGGLLVGATMTQKPDFCKVALPGVGVMDMLRYHKFTAGAGWAYDYGTSEDSPEMYEYLKKYSPIHALKPNTCYPATMVVTADHDDRVVPAHSFKFAATLQEDQSCANPTLIRIDVRSGHGAGRSTEKVIEETIDNFSFTLYNFGVKNIDENLKMSW